MAGNQADRSLCRVDHHRVLDKDSEKNPFELYEVLERVDVPRTKRKPWLVGPKIEVFDLCLWTRPESETLQQNINGFLTNA